MATSNTRRAFLVSGASLTALVALGLGARRFGSASATTIVARPGKVTLVTFSPAGARLGTETVDKLIKTEDEWRKQLSELAFSVTRQEGTERPGSGEYLNNHASGLYRCICCDTVLFDSATKFDSGTGWPSFWQPIARENVVDFEDKSYGMVRTANSCARCDAHLGHVFDDGPKPTGLRYCMNSVALKFYPRATA